VNNGPLNYTDPSGLAQVDENGDFVVGKGQKAKTPIPESNPVIEEQVKRDKANDDATRHDPGAPEHDNAYYNNKLAEILRNSLGADYGHLRPPTAEEMDCSGTLVYALQEMGFNVPDDLKVADLVSGKIPWIEFYDDVSEERQGQTGVLNFYDFDSGDYVHVNIGVGKYEDEVKAQVVDATEGDWMLVRNTSDFQVVPAQAGSLNQTYIPFSTNSTPGLQASIVWERIPRKAGN